MGPSSQASNIAAPPGSYPVVGDFNGDGQPDLAIASTNGVSGPAQCRRTELSCRAVVYPAWPPAILAAVLAMGDFNGDGKADLAVRDGAYRQYSARQGRWNLSARR